MGDSSPASFNTPKRKRLNVANEDALPALNTHFSFDLSHSLFPDGGNSPRTNVAHRFRGLALADNTWSSGGGVPAAPADEHGGTDTADWATIGVDGDESKMRKRTRLSPMPGSPSPQKPADPTDIPETPCATKGQGMPSADPNNLQPRLAPNDDCDAPLKPNSSVHGTLASTAFSSHLNFSPNRITKPCRTANNRLVETLKPKGRRRAGTPPLVAPITKAGNADQSGGPDAEIIDPVRAALTWHEDEITVYDPEDEDDDGTGINGIGFKPTPAIAYARTMKRKQQLAEYKKREEREARARRSTRRRGSPERPPKLERKPSDRKVRFTEADAAALITT